MSRFHRADGEPRSITVRCINGIYHVEVMLQSCANPDGHGHNYVHKGGIAGMADAIEGYFANPEAFMKTRGYPYDPARCQAPSVRYDEAIGQQS